MRVTSLLRKWLGWKEDVCVYIVTIRGIIEMTMMEVEGFWRWKGEDERLVMVMRRGVVLFLEDSIRGLYYV